MKLTMGLTRNQANKARRVSVLLNLVGFSFFVMGDVASAAKFKLIAESMRIPFYEHVEARDMSGLCLFFVCGSIVALILNN